MSNIFPFAWLRFKPRVLCMLGKHFTIVLRPHPRNYILVPVSMKTLFVIVNTADKM